MEMQITQTDVAIIGGGLAGLTAACYLARAGKKVTLFEKAPNLGGRAATQNYNDYRFNRGIHALYTGGAGSQVLQELEIQYSGRSPGNIFILRRGRLFTAPNDPRTLLGSKLFGLADKLELMRVFASLPQLNAHAFARMSVQEWLERNIRRPRVRQFMASNANTFVYSSALDLVSAEVFIAKTQLALKNPVVYIDGGWQALVDGLRRAAEQAGAHIMTGTRVEAVEHQNGRVQGVRLHATGTMQAASVIIATKPQEAAKLVDNGKYLALCRIVDHLIPAQVASLDVALRRLPNSRYTIVQDMERPRFMSTQSLYSRVTPEGGALIYTFKQLDPRRSTDPREDERELEDLLDVTQPGWRDVLIKRQYLPRIDAIGMLPTSETGGYAGRARPYVPTIANLYLAGDWIGEGFLSDASFGSARRVAREIVQQEMARVDSRWFAQKAQDTLPKLPHPVES